MTEHRKTAASTIAFTATRRFLAQVDNANGEQMSTTFATFLNGFSTRTMPDTAHDAWRQIARLLRSPADTAIPEKAILSMRSWPQSRIAELIDFIRDLHAVLEKIENDRLDDEIRDSIRRHYL